MKKAKLKRNIAALIVLGTVLSLSSCNQETNNAKSELIGKFSSSEATDVILSNSKDKKGTTETKNGVTYTYMYTSDLYPLNTVENEELKYNTSQSLRLKNDYSYEYSGDIILRKITTNGNTDLAKISFTSKGTFEYVQLDDTSYYVTLSDPTSGKEEVYGSYISDEGKSGNIYSWSLNSTPDYTIDLSLLANNEGAEFDRYVKGKSVTVKKANERVLENDVFYADFLDDVAPYCSFNSYASSDDEPEPVKPDDKEYENGNLDLPYVSYSDDVKVGLRIGEELSIIVNTPSNNSTISINSQEISSPIKSNNQNIFVYPISYDSLAADFSILVNESFHFVPKDYLTTLSPLESISLTKDSDESTLKQIALQSVVVSLLYKAEYFNSSLSLTDKENEFIENHLYSSKNENAYHKSNWELRNITADNDSKWKCEWKDGSLQDYGSLAFTFNIDDGNHSNLNAHINVDDRKPYTVKVEEVSSSEGKKLYKLKTNTISPIDYAKSVTVQIFDGDTQISGDCVYSINRAAAKADLSESQQDKALAKVEYSIGKSAYWYANSSNVIYKYKTPINTTGYYLLNLDEYTYSDDRMSVEQETYDTWGTSLYMNGQVLSEHSQDNEIYGEHFTATKAGSNRFNITMGGANVDAIRATDGDDTVVKISLKNTSTIKRKLINEWGDEQPSSSIKSSGSLRIGGENGAVLNVYGGISVKNKFEIADGVTVNVYGYDVDETAVTCGTLEISDNASLNIIKTDANSKNVSASSINVTNGNLDIDGTLLCDGFANGIHLGSANAQTINVIGGGLNISANQKGITGNTTETNNQLNFNGGESFIQAATGICYSNLSVGNAKLTVIANAGYTIQANNPVTIETTSGSYDKGKLNLINNYYNQWWDDSYVVNVKNMNLNGGSVYMFGMSKNGVVVTDTGATINVGNTNLTIENGHGPKTTAIGMRLEGGDEKVTFSSDARIIFKNCSTAVSCYAKASTATSYAQIENNGLIIQDTYRCSIVPWSSADDKNDIANWEMLLTFTNKGIVRSTNYVKDVE